MERKEMMMMMGVKMEDAIGSSSCSSSFPSMFDFSEEKGSLGFMELLGMQYSYNPPLDFPDDYVGSATLKDPPETGKEECSDVKQQPATPNSSSISSLSSDTAVVYDYQQNKTVDQPNQPLKQLKVKKTNEKKRQREARFAFMTKSEVDHLEDGYRWRKYGQKAVKNNSFPRSYYRCTSASCNVKKRVERSLSDPTIVVTTYEGQHTHPSPAMARSPHPTPNYFASPMAMPRNYMSQNYQYHHQQTLVNTLSTLGFPSLSSKNNNIATFPHPRARSSVLLRDHGLLQDVVPSHVMKEH